MTDQRTERGATDGPTADRPAADRPATVGSDVVRATVATEGEAAFDSSLPFDPTSPARSRRALTAHLTEHEVPRTAIENAAIVLYELLQNGIEHGEPCADHTVKVAWALEPCGVRMQVTDCGTPRGACAVARDTDPADPTDADDATDDPAEAAWELEEAWRRRMLTPVDMLEERGRGLHLVAALSSSWNVSTSEGGTTVTAVVSFDAR
ncbi:ATP-binding protein [Nocardioides sp. ChNu-153]|uniref:ATP-binding protein n=1 Tax=unclassified Nocardioides TaxID=2615069 RepID=UPI002404A586|nr:MULTISPECIES: ATP-binding protein [unclassified Nocardioides]MDF9715454.1 ATP-binding protein [Nocardioides sp. ChNu-99]MDN7120617.1 ATP-binding protein [Nocardioides sp. ChNu-153]